MQIINSSHHQTEKNSWTSGVVYDLLCRVRMYYVPGWRDEWGALRPTPPPPPGAVPPVPGDNHYILCAPEKIAAGVFYARLLIRLRCSDCNASTDLHRFANTSEK